MFPIMFLILSMKLFPLPHNQLCLQTHRPTIAMSREAFGLKWEKDWCHAKGTPPHHPPPVVAWNLTIFTWDPGQFTPYYVNLPEDLWSRASPHPLVYHDPSRK